MKIALLSSFTIEPVVRHLREALGSRGISVETYVGPFNAWAQEILRTDSGLKRFDSDVTVLAVDIDALIPDGTSLVAAPPEERRRQVRSEVEQILNLVKTLAQKSRGKILVHNFSIPVASPLGILDEKDEAGLRGLVAEANLELAAGLRSVEGAYVFDYDGFVRDVGRAQAYDPKMDFLAAMKIREEVLPRLADRYLKYLVPFAGKTRKVLVLDLDGTLWGGVVGEEGVSGIALGPQAPGNAYHAFQKAVVSLARRGAILAINSKNNADDALEVIRNHPHMLLREKDFAAIRINWQDKASNMREIAEELNLGLDSFVFADDDPGNRMLMRGMLPEVLTIDLPHDPARFAETLLDLPDFETARITDEDRERTSLYAAERERRQTASDAGSIEDYLRQLQIEVFVSEDDAREEARLSQLCQKTNQFNLTTRRYTEEDVRRFIADPAAGVWSIRAKDRFGDNGIVGLAIVRKEPRQWTLDSFLLSCRVIGRGVEQALLSRVAECARSSGAAELIGEFIPSAKNAPAQDFFYRNGFESVEQSDERSLWRLPLSKDVPAPEWIRYG
ncbi:hypothetical protein A3D72_01070 [Candidatus Uhrbacteria bacterium RIFCSPHIGHO2_02_FULL_57_19]|uniref:N-acetyltransferase domain-containing protein n=2 Tax=Parcubacteria group TaxID=1794811 RepID=A0A1F6CMQ6_9BACT|nr:MAG: hypothetical protein A2704_04510 [Candidatus Kaiserbacteria bacterium RIFCSPHIGHO2_01_FULL_54_36b]OGL72409.1 MAG: hypothetical protein A3D72_01070 [Candidatus Uhrbacteria bacterium RIFCSPHIGHO2_02_FULL_57_19]